MEIPFLGSRTGLPHQFGTGHHTWVFIFSKLERLIRKDGNVDRIAAVKRTYLTSSILRNRVARISWQETCRCQRCQRPFKSRISRLKSNRLQGTSMNELNLLLRHQIIKGSDDLALNYSMNSPQETYYEEEYSSSFVLPRKATFSDSVLEERCEELKIELANIQLEESSALEQHRTLIESYNLLEAMSEYLMNHIECVSLEAKSACRLSFALNSYAVREKCVDEKISSVLKQLTESYELSSLDRFKAKLLTILNHNNGNVKKLHNEFQERQSNYKLALKNFKIILEILNVNEDSLRKLKQQFDEVLMDYQHCRCILDHELPFAIAEKTKLLADCLISLGAEYDSLADRRKALASLFKDIGEKVHDNEYILVKKELHSPRSCDND